MARPSRRGFVSLLALAWPAARVRPLAALLPVVVAGRSADDRLRVLLPDMRAAAAVGRHLLARRAVAADEAHGLAAVLAGAGEGETALREIFAGACRADFARGNVVLADGWVLARSEGRLCALAALRAAEPA